MSRGFHAHDIMYGPFRPIASGPDGDRASGSERIRGASEGIKRGLARFYCARILSPFIRLFLAFSHNLNLQLSPHKSFLRHYVALFLFDCKASSFVFMAKCTNLDNDIMLSCFLFTVRLFVLFPRINS